MGPTTSWPSANTARNTVIDAVTAGVDTCSDAAICGKDGSRILVASVPVAARDASTAICRKVEDTSGSGVVSIARVWSAMEAPGLILNDVYHIKRGREAVLSRAGMRKPYCLRSL